jgi:hypothetical protein
VAKSNRLEKTAADRQRWRAGGSASPDAATLNMAEFTTNPKTSVHNDPLRKEAKAQLDRIEEKLDKLTSLMLSAQVTHSNLVPRSISL